MCVHVNISHTAYISHLPSVLPAYRFLIKEPMKPSSLSPYPPFPSSLHPYLFSLLIPSLPLPSSLLLSIPTYLPTYLPSNPPSPQMALLEDSMVSMRRQFNERFLALRDLKKQIVLTVRRDNSRIREIDIEVSQDALLLVY